MADGHPPLSSKLATEFLGTFLFLLVISMVAGMDSATAPFAIGFALVSLVYLGGHVSGAHYNPAITLMFALSRRCSWLEAGLYMTAQFLAGLLAFAFGAYLMGSTPGIQPNSAIGPLRPLIVEAVFTFLIGLVIINVATAKANRGRDFSGIAIGAVVTSAIVAGGGLSGGAFNPAVGVGATVSAALKNGMTWNHLWIYLVGPFAGGILAAVIYPLQNRESAAI